MLSKSIAEEELVDLLRIYNLTDYNIHQIIDILLDNADEVLAILGQMLGDEK